MHPYNVRVVTPAMNQDGYALIYASDDMKNNKEVAAATVTRHGCVLKHARNDTNKNKRAVTAGAVVRQTSS